MSKGIKILLISGLLIFGSSLFSSCTSKITEEQLATLQELRRSEASIKDEISKVQSDSEKLKNELRDLQNQIKECEDKKKFIEEKLKTWPNVWPGWDPAELGNEGNTK